MISFFCMKVSGTIVLAKHENCCKNACKKLDIPHIAKIWHPSDYFFFDEVKLTLMRNKITQWHGKRVAENLFMGRDLISTQNSLKSLSLRSDTSRNIFGNYTEKWSTNIPHKGFGEEQCPQKINVNRFFKCSSHQFL